MDKKTLRAVNDEIRFFDDTCDNQLAITLLGAAFTGTVSFEASGNLGAAWVACPAVPIAGGASVTSATADGIWLIFPGTGSGFPGTKGLWIRARLSALTGGTVDVFFQPTKA